MRGAAPVQRVLREARSRLNAITHGLTAKQIVVGAEKPEEFDAFRQALFTDLEPNGTFQCELVDEIADSSGACDGFPCWKQTC